jgi:CysZ protein
LLFLLKNPPLWPLAALPALLAVTLGGAGLVGSLYFVPRVEAALGPSRERVGDVLALLASIVLALLTLATGAMLGLGIALALTAPLLDLLSQKAERREQGLLVDQGRGLGFEIRQSLRGAFFFAAAVPLAFLIGLVPFAGPPLATLWGAFALAFQFTDGPLSRRGRSFSEKLRWHREWRPEALGFGLAGLVTLIVPFANLLVAPALTVGAARLVLELSGSGRAARATHGLQQAAEEPPSNARVQP